MVITGCGRSGTKYTALVLQKLGLDAQHEALGLDVTISWPLAVCTDEKVWGPSTEEVMNYYGKNVIMLQQVRNPIDVISSCRYIKRVSWDYIGKFINIDKCSRLERAMKYYYFWNRYIELKAQYTFRVENLLNELDIILKLGGFNTDRLENFGGNAISRTTNTRETNHSKVTLSEMKEENALLTQMIVDQAMSYGYKMCQCQY